MKPVLATVLLGLVLLAAPARAQPASANISSVMVERITVHGASLEGNLEGDSPDRAVSVYLPPSYGRAPARRYPIIYGLHGHTINNEIWSGQIQAQNSLAVAFAAGAREMILVLPSAQTLHNGSMCSGSVTIADWESFIAHDVVTYNDAHYPTIAQRESRV